MLSRSRSPFLHDARLDGARENRANADLTILTDENDSDEILTQGK